MSVQNTGDLLTGPNFGTPIVVNGQTTALATGSLTTLARADHVHTVSNVPVLLASTTLASDAASYTFSGIPQTYTHLRLLASVRVATVNTTAYFRINYNNNSSSTYYSNAVAGSTTETRTALISGGGQYFANLFSSLDIVIADYASSTKGKSETCVFMLYQGTAAPGLLDGTTWSNYWNNTSAITSLVLSTSNGTIAAGSKFRLYGLP